MSAAIEFCPGRFYVGLWYYEMPGRLSRFGKGGNFLAVLWRQDEEPEHWHLDYRIRHYRDERISDSEDLFVSHTMEGMRSSEGVALEKATQAMQIIALMGGNRTLMFIEVRGDSYAVMKKLEGMPMFHAGRERVQ